MDSKIIYFINGYFNICISVENYIGVIYLRNFFLNLMRLDVVRCD